MGVGNDKEFDDLVSSLAEAYNQVPDFFVPRFKSLINQAALYEFIRNKHQCKYECKCELYTDAHGLDYDCCKCPTERLFIDDMYEILRQVMLGKHDIESAAQYYPVDADTIRLTVKEAMKLGVYSTMLEEIKS